MDPMTDTDQMTILLIEDDTALKDLFARALRAAGYVVESTPSVAGARQHLLKQPAPDIVLLDLMLEDGSGLPVLEMLRQPRFRNTYVVVVSAIAFTADDQLELYRDRIDQVLLKPVFPRGLVALVRNAQKWPGTWRGHQASMPPATVV
jgi:DNA-binding response OmpR family regulator